LPMSYDTICKMMGGWVRNQLFYEDDKQRDNQDWQARNEYTQSKEYKKFKVYCYLRSKKIAEIITGLAWKTFKYKFNVEDALIKKIYSISWRMVREGKRGQYVMADIYRTYSRMSPYMGNIFLSDLSKYNVAFARYILEETAHNTKYMFPEGYKELVTKAPAVIKKNKYGLMFRIENIEPVLGNYMPQNRFQYFCARVACHTYSSYMAEITYNRDSYMSPYREFLLKMSKSDIAMWHYFKKAYHLTGPYNTKALRHMVQVVCDGARIYADMKDNALGIAFVSIEGSPMRMLRNAIYNHRQEQELTKKRRLSGPDCPMTPPPLKLPEWMENIRMKTAHEMITAGIECEHCIGSFTNSNDIFFREGNICAQVRRNDLTVQQCFDVMDRITPASKSLQSRISKALESHRHMVGAI